MSKKYKTLDELLADMPLFLEEERKLCEKGMKEGSFRKTADPDDKYTFFMKNGKRGYKSECPNFSGYWLDGVHGGVACSKTDFVLPGLILEVYCKNNCSECPLNRKGDLEYDYT